MIKRRRWSDLCWLVLLVLLASCAPPETPAEGEVEPAANEQMSGSGTDSVEPGGSPDPDEPSGANEGTATEPPPAVPASPPRMPPRAQALDVIDQVPGTALTVRALIEESLQVGEVVTVHGRIELGPGCDPCPPGSECPECGDVQGVHELFELAEAEPISVRVFASAVPQGLASGAHIVVTGQVRALEPLTIELGPNSHRIRSAP